ncbi:MAG: protein kinase domain-containing protein [Planctomycetota bacterium]|jgi:hypothetical protein
MLLKHVGGVPLSTYDSGTDLADKVRIAVRVTEALAYAHGHGVVHRDLKPDNIIIGHYGEVTVIDWGLAAQIGQTSQDRCGTPAWMAPEQATATTPDPRMDVWALGAILGFLFHGQPPRDDSDSRQAAIPSGLRELVAHCLATDPAARYADASAILDELHRWQAAGITRAQRPSAWRRLRAGCRRHPTVSATAMIIALALAALLLVHHDQRQQRLAHIDALGEQIRHDTPLHDATAVATARDHIAHLRRSHGERASLITADAHLRAAADSLAKRAHHDELRQRLHALDRHFRTHGPHPDEIAARQALFALAGVDPLNPATFRDHPLRADLAANLTLLHLRRLVACHDDEHTDHHHRQPLTPLLSAADPGGPWAALAVIIDHADIGPHDLILASHDLHHCLADPASAAALLASATPDPRLLAYAQERIAEQANAFWPRIVLARQALMNNQPQSARDHALIALGHTPDSIWPQLILAYLALESGDEQALANHLSAITAVEPHNIEARTIHAAHLAKSGAISTAQAIIDDLNAWAHLARHHGTASHHPMDLSLAILREHGVRLQRRE